MREDICPSRNAIFLWPGAVPSHEDISEVFRNYLACTSLC
jgi:hypothetical protein